jgi:hypothetical protein
MTAEAETEGVRLSNYNMAAARLGVVVLMTPLVGFGIACALLAARGPLAYGLAGFLVLILIALWATVINLTWMIQLDETGIVIQRMFRRQRRPLSDLTQVRVQSIKSQFTRRMPLRHTVLAFDVERLPPALILKPDSRGEHDLLSFLHDHGVPIVNDDWVASGLLAISRALMNGR